MSEKKFKRVGWAIFDNKKNYTPDFYPTKKEAQTYYDINIKCACDAKDFVIKPVYVEAK